MIIDIHTHTYPEAIAKRAIDRLAKQTDIFNYTDGTKEGLINAQVSAGVDYSVVLPVATKATQTNTINLDSYESNKNTGRTHLIYFAGIHPDNTDYRSIIKGIADMGFKGIKLHPMFQSTPLDDERYLRIIDCSASQGLCTMIHGGGDINFPDLDYASPEREKKMLDILGNPPMIIFAHMGGWHNWEEAFSLLSGYDVFFDTSSCLAPFLTYDGKEVTGKYRSPLNDTLFRNMVDCFGADHILYGSDSPWGSQKANLDALSMTGLDESELRLIRGENARKLLKL